MNVFESPIWQFVGVVATIILGVLAILVTVYVYRKQTKRKKLEYEIITVSPLVNIRNEFKDSLEIRFDGNPISDPRLLLMRVINTGDIPILASDFEQEITISFGDGTKVHTAEISETNPSSLQSSVTIQSNHITLKKTLFNEQDWIEIRAILSNFGDGIRVGGRIVGVKKVDLLETKPKYSNLIKYYYIFGFIFCVISVILFYRLIIALSHNLAINDLVASFVNLTAFSISAITSAVLLILGWILYRVSKA